MSREAGNGSTGNRHGIGGSACGSGHRSVGNREHGDREYNIECGHYGRATGETVPQVTGRGTGIDDDGYRRKVEVIEQAIMRHQPGSDRSSRRALEGGRAGNRRTCWIDPWRSCASDSRGAGRIHCRGGSAHCGHVAATVRRLSHCLAPIGGARTRRDLETARTQAAVRPEPASRRRNGRLSGDRTGARGHQDLDADGHLR